MISPTPYVDGLIAGATEQRMIWSDFTESLLDDFDQALLPTLDATCAEQVRGFITHWRDQLAEVRDA